MRDASTLRMLRRPWRFFRRLTLLLSLAAISAGCASTPQPSQSHTPLPPAPHATSDWLTFGYDAARSGVNPAPQPFTRTTVSRLTKRWSVMLPDVADSSPILLHALAFPGRPRDVLYLTTRDGHLIALDASDGSLLWSHQPSGPKITNSSPVADSAHHFVYAYGLDGALHRYNPVSGQEATGPGWPAPVTLMTQTEKESSALNLANGRVYVTTSGYFGDAPPYQGHLVTVDEASGAEHVFNTLCANQHRLLGAGDCAGQDSGIWARGGAVVDPENGDIYLTTGNGPFDANHGGSNFGDSILRLSSDGSRLLDSYTPANFQYLADTDRDLGSSSTALLPRIAHSATPLLLVQGGKDNHLKLIDRQNMSGQHGPGHVGGELQSVDLGCALFTQPAIWTDPVNGRVWAIVDTVCGMRGFVVATNAAGVTRLTEAWRNDTVTTSPVIAGGVLFAAGENTVQAIDPTSGQILWDSRGASAGGTTGQIHWESPIVVDGAVYSADESGSVTCYTLRP
ncbi:MAG TPA: PQQ-binding-like beta-propeller repeat protein [Ktedonobacterales bacterium]